MLGLLWSSNGVVGNYEICAFPYALGEWLLDTDFVGHEDDILQEVIFNSGSSSLCL